MENSFTNWYLNIGFWEKAIIFFLVFIILLMQLRYRISMKRNKVSDFKKESETTSLLDTIGNYKKINDKLEDVQLQFLDIDKIKEEIIAIILHDLWSPLNFVADAANGIVENKDKYSQAELLSFLTSLNNTANNMVSLVDQLLKWLRTQQGTLEVNITAVNVSDLFDNVVNLYDGLVLERKNIIKIECTTTATIDTDATILALIVRNMVDNANKNTKNGDITLQCEARKDLGYYLLTISDNGKGFEPDKVRLLMELADNKTLESGSLGLKFSFEFAKLINAQINIESKVGKGTSVFIKLPFIEQPISKNKAEPS